MNPKPERPAPSSKPVMPHIRLCDAADILLAAAQEVGRQLNILPPRPDALKGAAIEPPVLRAFTPEEVREATEFLIRLGVEFGPLTRR